MYCVSWWCVWHAAEAAAEWRRVEQRCRSAAEARCGFRRHVRSAVTTQGLRHRARTKALRRRYPAAVDASQEFEGVIGDVKHSWSGFQQTQSCRTIRYSSRSLALVIDVLMHFLSFLTRKTLINRKIAATDANCDDKWIILMLIITTGWPKNLGHSAFFRLSWKLPKIITWLFAYVKPQGQGQCMLDMSVMCEFAHCIT